jgi:predicted nucleic acid-binding protein
VNFLLDTNVVSEWVRPKPDPNVVAWLAATTEDTVRLSVITIAELERGIRLLPDGARRERLERWLAGDLLERFEGRLLDVTADVAREWGRISASARKAGRPIGVVDAFFAATARVGELTLVTRNDAHFRDTGVDLLNPWLPAGPKTRSHE